MSTIAAPKTVRSVAVLMAAMLALWPATVPQPAGAATSSATLTPTDDTYVYSGTHADANYGSSTTLVVKTASGSDRIALLTFGLAGLSSVSSAVLRVYGHASANTTLDASTTNGAWNESTVTWNTMPAIGSLVGTTTIGTTQQYYDIDVTDSVQAQLSGGSAAFALQETTGTYTTFNSKEASSNPPQLLVDGSSSSGGDTQPPTAPTGLTATAQSSSSIGLAWSASTDNVGVAGYDIYRDGVEVGSTAATSFTDTGLNASTSYSYVVAAYDAAGNVSGSSNTASAITASSGGTGGGTGIELGIWALQQPDGSTISSSRLSAGYTSPYFSPAADGGQAFMDTQTGSTTSGSLHPRSEMREQTSSGSNAAWDGSGTNTMTNTAAVTLQGGGSSGRTTIGQVFDSTDSIPLCEFEYTSSPNSMGGNFQLLYEEAKGAGTTTYLPQTASLGTRFTYRLSLTDGVLAVSVDGQQVYSHTPSYSGKTFFFKAGDYDQTATSGSVSTTPYTIVELYSVNVVHS